MVEAKEGQIKNLADLNKIVEETLDQATSSIHNEEPEVVVEPKKEEPALPEVKDEKKVEEPDVKPEKVEQPVIPAFTPNLKFKVYDEEKEFDPLFVPLVKDEESYKKVKEFHEKAYGLPKVKEKLEKTREEKQKIEDEFSKVYSEHSTLNQAVNELLNLKDQDLDLFFKKLNVPQMQVVNLVKKWIDLEQSPQAKQAYEANMQSTMQNMQLQQQAITQQAQLEAMMRKQHEAELALALQDQEIKQVQDNLDAKMGAGFFMEQVKAYGQQTYLTQGKNLTPIEAISHIASKFKPFVSVGQASVPNTQPIVSQPITQPAKPVASIPNIKGSGSSPVSKRFKRITDLENEYDSISGKVGA